MDQMKTTSSPARLKRRTAVILLAILLTGGLFAWWMVVRADRELRADLLQQGRLVAQALDLDQVRALSGTEADLDNPAYLRLKEQLAATRSANPQCRFIYLMGRHADGAVYFFLDSEPATSKDYSPPGQVYEEIPASFRRVLESKVAGVAGPASDRWGTWISALVPLTDPQTNAVVAVLGMDIDARDWTWDVAARAALPVGLMLVLLIGATTGLVSARRVAASPRPVLRRLLPPLAIMVFLLLAGTGALLWQQEQQQMAREIAADSSDASGDLRAALDLQAIGLAAVGQPIAADATTQKALREGDADRLLALWRPAFETLRRENHLTHLYFFDADRVCLLRVHSPGQRGDRIMRFTAIEAERTGKTFSGLELGSQGTLTLRVVQPVFEGRALVGYVELGKEIADALQTLHTRSGSQLAIVIRKELLTRQRWEGGMRLLGRQADWDRMPGSVVSYASQGRLPDAFATWADQVASDHARDETDRPISSDGRDWRASAVALFDASGKTVADLLVMRDVSADQAAFARLMTLGGTTGAVLLALLLGFIVVLLRRTDAGIRAQQEGLRESQARFEQLAEQSGTIAWEVDTEGLFTYVSQVSEAVWSYRPNELVGRMHFYDLHPESGREPFKTAAFAVFARQEPFHNLINATQAQDGRVVWVSTNGIPLLNADGALRGYRGSDTDITERKQAEAALAHSQAQLLQAQKMEAVGRLAGGVAHDFNNIMQSLLSLSTVLRVRAGAPELARVVKEIEAHIKRGAGLTQQMLLFSRRQMVEMKPVDLGRLVGAAGGLLRRLIPENIRLVVETAPEPLWVNGDTGQLQQVLMNLAVNARDAMPEGGTLTVRTSGDHAEAVIDVIDTGHGMDEATRARLFEPFFTTKEPGKGTGLGLSVAHGIVQQHSGRIEVEGAPGEGSQFRVILPAVPAPDETTDELLVKTELLHGHGERVLIVEDEEGARQGLTELLAILGYQVTAVGSGEEAGILPAELAPDLLLTDLMLPGITGSELATGLRARWPRLKVVLMSGYTEDEVVRRGVSEGSTRFLQKPFDLDALAAELHAALQNQDDGPVQETAE